MPYNRAPTHFSSFTHHLDIVLKGVPAALVEAKLPVVVLDRFAFSDAGREPKSCNTSILGVVGPCDDVRVGDAVNKSSVAVAVVEELKDLGDLGAVGEAGVVHGIPDIVITALECAKEHA